jgi:hypothetical protein
VIEPHEYDPPDRSEIDETSDSELAREVQKLERAWQGARAFIDLNAIDSGAVVNGEQHPVEYFFREVRQRGLDAVPVIGLASDNAYVAAAAEAALGGHGAMLRLFFGELDDFDLDTAIQDRLAAIRLRPEDIDLLVDLEALRHPVGRAVHAALLELSGREWRSITAASGAFPQSLAAYRLGVHRLPRVKSAFWRVGSGSGGA